MTTLNERFWSKVAKTDSCWNWLGYKTRQGYGRLYDRPREVTSGLAHRISWRLHFGEIPDQLHVLHRCDNPSCVNPEHLFLGTNDDNQADKLRKRRHSFGSKVHCSKANEILISNIRALFAAGMNSRLIKELFGLRLRAFTRGHDWKHVPCEFNFSLPRERRFFVKSRGPTKNRTKPISK